MSLHSLLRVLLDIDGGKNLEQLASVWLPGLARAWLRGRA
jgi:hypothetical protein